MKILVIKIKFDIMKRLNQIFAKNMLILNCWKNVSIKLRSKIYDIQYNKKTVKH